MADGKTVGVRDHNATLDERNSSAGILILNNGGWTNGNSYDSQDGPQYFCPIDDTRLKYTSGPESVHQCPSCEVIYPIAEDGNANEDDLRKMARQYLQVRNRSRDRFDIETTAKLEKTLLLASRKGINV